MKGEGNVRRVWRGGGRVVKGWTRERGWCSSPAGGRAGAGSKGWRAAWGGLAGLEQPLVALLLRAKPSKCHFSLPPPSPSLHQGKGGGLKQPLHCSSGLSREGYFDVRQNESKEVDGEHPQTLWSLMEKMFETFWQCWWPRLAENMGDTLMMKPMRPRRDSVMMMFSSENVRLAKRRSSCKKRWASQINWREREGVD